jgi:hypothetical protein
MTQPSFVPISGQDQVRPSLHLEAPRRWTSNRVAEQVYPARTGGARRGTPGPDQGYALRLAHRFADRLQLGEGEHAEDVLVGCALLAARRAGMFGRAPSVYDLEAAFAVWGFFGPVPEGLLERRRMAFSSASHDYAIQRDLVDRIPDAALRLTSGELSIRVAAGDWPTLTGGPVV